MGQCRRGAATVVSLWIRRELQWRWRWTHCNERLLFYTRSHALGKSKCSVSGVTNKLIRNLVNSLTRNAHRGSLFLIASFVFCTVRYVLFCLHLYFYHLDFLIINVTFEGLVEPCCLIVLILKIRLTSYQSVANKNPINMLCKVNINLKYLGYYAVLCILIDETILTDESISQAVNRSSMELLNLLFDTHCDFLYEWSGSFHCSKLAYRLESTTILLYAQNWSEDCMPFTNRKTCIDVQMELHINKWQIQDNQV